MTTTTATIMGGGGGGLVCGGYLVERAQSFLSYSIELLDAFLHPLVPEKQSIEHTIDVHYAMSMLHMDILHMLIALSIA